MHICKILLILFIFGFAAHAQENNILFLNDADMEESSSDPEEQAIMLPYGAKFEEGPPIDSVIEAVGTVEYSTVPIYTTADKSSKIIRYALPREKVIITANNDSWYCVRMYNGKEGFVEKRHLKTMKVFYDESITANHMDKRISVELNDLVVKFNKKLSESVYLEKFQIVPRVTLVSSSKSKNVITLTLEYSAVDRFGSVIPSKQENALSSEMRSFIELLFMKMLPAGAETYIIEVRKPEFSFNGRVLNTQGSYAEIKLKHKDIDIAAIKERKKTVLSVLTSNIPPEKLFNEYPN